MSWWKRPRFSMGQLFAYTAGILIGSFLFGFLRAWLESR